MIAPRNLKHNALKQVSVARPRELYAQFGLSKSLDASKYSGDDTLSQNVSKVDAARQVIKDDADAAKQADEAKED